MRRGAMAHGSGLLLALCLMAAAVPARAQTPVEPLILSPEPGEQIAQGSVGVAVSFIDPGLRVDPASIRLVVGGVDVTSQARITAELVTWRPAQPLRRGPQRATLTVSDRNGVQLPPVSWSFVVTPPTDDSPLGTDQTEPSGGLPSWARLQGSVVFENTTAAVSGSGADSRRDEGFTPRLWVNANGYLTTNIRYNARVHVSGYETSRSQPVNRYRLSVRSDRFNVTVGDANPYMHDLILDGRRVRGIEGQLQLGPFGLQVVKGRDRRAIDARLAAGDTIVEQFGTFGRDIFAIRPTFGTGEHFQFGLTVLKARDDVGSISDLRTDPLPSDGSTQSANFSPKDNLVFGTNISTRLIGGRLTLEHHAAVSLLANDISGGPITRADLDDLLDELGQEDLSIPGLADDFEPADYEKYFILNGSLTPLDPTGLTSLAQSARVGLQVADHYASAEFRSVGSAFYSLGNPSLQRDRVGYRIQDAFSLLDRSLALTVGFDRDDDNVDDLKSATTTTSEFFIDANWQPSPTGPGVSGGIRLGGRSSDAAPGDNGALDETTRTYGLGVVYPIDVLEGYRTRVSANWSLITRDDPENPEVGTNNYYYLVGFSGETIDRSQEFSVLYGLNRSVLTEFNGVHTNFHRLAASGRRQVAPRWSALADITLTLARSPDEAIDQGAGFAYNRIELLGGGEWEWTPSAFVTLEAGIVSFSDDVFDDANTRELLTRIRVSRPF